MLSCKIRTCIAGPLQLALPTVQDAMLQQYREEIARLRAELDATPQPAGPVQEHSGELHQEPSPEVSWQLDEAEEAALKAEIEAELLARCTALDASTLSAVSRLHWEQGRVLHCRHWACLGMQQHVTWHLPAARTSLACQGHSFKLTPPPPPPGSPVDQSVDQSQAGCSSNQDAGRPCRRGWFLVRHGFTCRIMRRLGRPCSRSAAAAS